MASAPTYPPKSSAARSMSLGPESRSPDTNPPSEDWRPQQTQPHQEDEEGSSESGSKLVRKLLKERGLDRGFAGSSSGSKVLAASEPRDPGSTT